eukprot:6511210-Pyramimonas_sp.AAC.1
MAKTCTGGGCFLFTALSASGTRRSSVQYRRSRASTARSRRQFLCATAPAPYLRMLSLDSSDEDEESQELLKTVGLRKAPASTSEALQVAAPAFPKADPVMDTIDISTSSGGQAANQKADEPDDEEGITKVASSQRRAKRKISLANDDDDDDDDANDDVPEIPGGR